MFKGENPEGWLFHVELYFEMNRLLEAKRLMAAGVSFEGEALAWFRWTDARFPFGDLSKLKRQLLRRFGSSQAGSLCEHFLNIQHCGTVAEYQRDFEVMSATMVELLDEILESMFVKGLKPEIRAEVRFSKPIGLGSTMETAQLIEDKNQALRAIKNPTTNNVVRPNFFREFKPLMGQT